MSGAYRLQMNTRRLMQVYRKSHDHFVAPGFPRRLHSASSGGFSPGGAARRTGQHTSCTTKRVVVTRGGVSPCHQMVQQLLRQSLPSCLPGCIFFVFCGRHLLRCVAVGRQGRTKTKQNKSRHVVAIGGSVNKHSKLHYVRVHDSSIGETQGLQLSAHQHVLKHI